MKAKDAGDGVRSGLDWAAFAPLRLRARTAAEGAFSGMHKSVRKGSGVEFAGHRAYAAGDDLRFVDRHALMRHGELLVREFETETDRALYLVVDASSSMRFRGRRAPGPKFGFAAVLVAAFAWLAVRGGDRVALDWLGGTAGALPRATGSEAFERLLDALEASEAEGEIGEAELERALSSIERRAGRGAIVLVASDLLDLPGGAPERLAVLAGKGRSLVVVQTLDPDELEFPFEGPVRLRALEGGRVVDTDAASARAGYLEALARLTGRYREALVARGAELLTVSTATDPVEVVRRTLSLFERGAR